MNGRTMSWLTLCLSAAVCAALAASLALACVPGCSCTGGHKNGCSTCNMGSPVYIKEPGIGPCTNMHTFSADYSYDVTDEGATSEQEGCSTSVSSAIQSTVACISSSVIAGASGNLGSEATWKSTAAPNGSTGYPYNVTTFIECREVDTQGHEITVPMQNARYGTYQCSNNFGQ